MADDLNRRSFLKGSAAAAALAGPAVIPARGANDKINVGWIGVGTARPPGYCKGTAGDAAIFSVMG